MIIRVRSIAQLPHLRHVSVSVSRLSLALEAFFFFSCLHGRWQRRIKRKPERALGPREVLLSLRIKSRGKLRVSDSVRLHNAIRIRVRIPVVNMT